MPKMTSSCRITSEIPLSAISVAEVSYIIPRISASQLIPYLMQANCSDKSSFSLVRTSPHDYDFNLSVFGDNAIERINQ